MHRFASRSAARPRHPLRIARIMNAILRPAFVAFVAIVTLLMSPAKESSAQSESRGPTSRGPTGWSAVVLPTGDYRQHIKAMPIEKRPGRLLHVYGNTVRMFDQAGRGHSIRPFRQIVLGTTRLRPTPAGR